MTDLLEKLVREWCEAQLAIDRLTVEQRQRDNGPLLRMVAAHNNLREYAEQHLVEDKTQ